MSNPADQSAADAAASQASTALRGSKTLEESVNHALSAINISKLSRETDQQSATSTPTDHAAKKRRVDSGGRVRVSLLEQIQIAEEKTRNAFARNRNSTQSPAQTPVQTHAPTPAPQAAPTASSVAPPAPTVGPTTTDAASAFTTASPQALMSTVATAPSVTSAAPPQTVLSPSPQLVTTDTIDHLPIPIPEPASNAASSDLTALTGTGISENQYGFGSTTGGVLDPALTYSFTQVAVPQQTGISQLNPNILSDVGVKLDPEPNTGQSFGLESAILPTNLKPSNGNNTQFKARSLPILENLATQILSLVSQSSFQDIAAIAAEPTSETAQAYSTMRSLFEHTRRLYSD
ncbi:TTAGGG repeat binding factor, partial [Ascosphaera aggregata]